MCERDHFAVFTASLRQLVFFSLSVCLLWLRMDSDKQLVAPHPPTASAQSQRLLQVSLSQGSRPGHGWMDGIKMCMDGWMARHNDKVCSTHDDKKRQAEAALALKRGWLQQLQRQKTPLS